MSATKSPNRVAAFFRRLRVPYLILCNTALLFFVLELGTRVVLQVSRGDDEGARHRDESIHPYFQAMQAPGPGVDAGPDLAGAVVTHPELANQDANLRLMFLGGSTTANDYPTRVGSELSAKVTNLAADGAPSLLSLFKFWAYVDIVQPHALVVLHNINDFYRGFTPSGMLPTYRSDYSHFVWNRHWQVTPSGYDGRPVFTEGPLHRASVSSLFSTMLRGSRLFEELSQRRPRAATFESMSADVVLRALPAFERHMGNLIQSARTKGVPVFVVTMPFTAEPPKRSFLYPGPHFTNDGTTFLDGEGFAEGMRAFNESVRALGKQDGVTLIDAAAQIQGEGQFLDEVHLTEPARKALADLVITALTNTDLTK